MKTSTTAELLHLAREARERHFALGRAYTEALGPEIPDTMPRPAKRLHKAAGAAYRRWDRRAAMLERAIQEECERA